MPDSVNKTPSQETQSKVAGGFQFDPELSENLWSEGPFPTFSQNIGGFNLTSYQFADGSEGLAVYNGKVALHFDNNNNITLAAGPPSQSGCGGKMITNVQQQLTKAKSVVVEVTGRDDGGVREKTTDDDGNVEEKDLPSYSLKVYGPVMIEALGGDVAIKGDNVTINSGSTLNLKSNKDINIQAGENGGKINMTAASINMDAGFLNKDISGGEYTTGAGEVKVEQNKSGSSVTVETPGSVRYIVNGEYSLGVKKDFKVDVAGSYILNIDKDYGAKTLGDYANVVSGKALWKVNGVGSNSKQQQNLLIDVLPAKGAQTPGFEVNSTSLLKFTNQQGGFQFEVGKKLANMVLEPKKFEVTTGSKMGAISMDQKSVSMEFGKSSKIQITPAEVSVKAPMIYLN